MARDINALIHLYRGELGRMTAYRIRLDTTSNWALGASVAVLTFALGDPDVPHAVIFLAVVLTLVFALLEARRLQDLELIRARVRLLEEGFLAPQFGEEPPAGWDRALGESLARPRAPIGLVAALANRVRRNYVWLLVTLYGAWWLKLSMSARPLPAAADVGWLAGEVVIVLATLLVASLLALAAWSRPLLPG